MVFPGYCYNQKQNGRAETPKQIEFTCAKKIAIKKIDMAIFMISWLRILVNGNCQTKKFIIQCIKLNIMILNVLYTLLKYLNHFILKYINILSRFIKFLKKLIKRKLPHSNIIFVVLKMQQDFMAMFGDEGGLGSRKKSQPQQNDFFSNLLAITKQKQQAKSKQISNNKSKSEEIQNHEYFKKALKPIKVQKQKPKLFAPKTQDQKTLQYGQKIKQAKQVYQSKNKQKKYKPKIVDYLGVGQWSNYNKKPQDKPKYYSQSITNEKNKQKHRKRSFDKNSQSASKSPIRQKRKDEVRIHNDYKQKNRSQNRQKSQYRQKQRHKQSQIRLQKPRYKDSRQKERNRSRDLQRQKAERHRQRQIQRQKDQQREKLREKQKRQARQRQRVRQRQRQRQRQRERERQKNRGRQKDVQKQKRQRQKRRQRQRQIEQQRRQRHKKKHKNAYDQEQDDDFIVNDEEQQQQQVWRRQLNKITKNDQRRQLYRKRDKQQIHESSASRIMGQDRFSAKYGRLQEQEDLRRQQDERRRKIIKKKRQEERQR